MSQPSVQSQFAAALDALVGQVREDRTILAAVLCGSLAYDTVWSRSDIDLVFVTVDDKRVDRRDVTLSADGIPVHAFLWPRAEFRKAAEGSIRNSFTHSFVAKGRLLFTHDPTIADLHARMQDIGERDTAIQLLRAATAALPAIDKAHKWFVTRGDLDYAALWILNAALPLARIEIVERRLLADREVLPQALTLNPAFFKKVYVDLLNEKKTAAKVQSALDAADRYVADRAPVVFAPIIDYLRGAGEARSCAEIEDYFTRHMDVSDVTTACEYLAHRGLIGKAAAPVRLTKRSNVDMQELAFFHIADRLEP
ncbi:MAG TPA: hypothetical protein VFV95_01640 [Vicinamibacterales bacterium]|nr:hypothetical protein [Vicinamibacterales bacterium]